MYFLWPLHGLLCSSCIKGKNWGESVWNLQAAIEKHLEKKSEPARNEGVSFYLLPLFSSAFVYLCVPKQSTSGADMNNSCKMIWVPMYLCSKQSQKNMNEHLQLLSPCWVCIIKFHNQKNWDNYIKHAEKNEGRNF